MRISRDTMLMDIAGTVAMRSTCSRQSVGVVISVQGRVLSTGYNGAPAGMEHCRHICDCTGPFDLFMGGHHYSACSSLQPCTVSVHAEANAIAWAARYGVKILGSEMHTTFSPCLPCGQLVINAGIERVVYGREHRDMRGLELCENAGLEITCLPV